MCIRLGQLDWSEPAVPVCSPVIWSRAGLTKLSACQAQSRLKPVHRLGSAALRPLRDLGLEHRREGHVLDHLLSRCPIFA